MVNRLLLRQPSKQRVSPLTKCLWNFAGRDVGIVDLSVSQSIPRETSLHIPGQASQGATCQCMYAFGLVMCAVFRVGLGYNEQNV